MVWRGVMVVGHAITLNQTEWIPSYVTMRLLLRDWNTRSGSQTDTGGVPVKEVALDFDKVMGEFANLGFICPSVKYNRRLDRM
jgi:hypothetical protein